ncbi:hypothetical protein B5M44_03955 [Shinella sumterensis]|uniref:DUF1937 family protein n=1 Tax=Shinella sumterensis TaxID=1967501 RepID=UPI00106E8BFD|nr:DUF1937 family protein [Shinella sumterensis]MCD1264102.1 DUF1937 family protein [Shinella sumterensis]TFE99368.1 hypothetical protein B5M44_03955 [Shinella sumterensis]
MYAFKNESPVPVELTTTAFGSLEKYRPANDNVPATHVAAGMSVDSAGNMRPMLPQPEFDGGIYVGLRRPASTDSRQFYGDNPHMEMTPEERLPQGLALLADQSGYVYLGSPYSKYEAGHDAAARVVADAAARLMRFGMVVYSPIAHGHAITLAGDLPLTWDFWKRQCQPLVDGAAGMIVLTMAGWQESVGLQYEIEEFVRAGKPILHVSPRWLAENKVGRV